MKKIKTQWLLPVLLAFTLTACSGTRPENLGVHDGKLTACPASPNCVNSQGDPADKEHYIEPIAYEIPRAQARETLKAVIQATSRTKIIQDEPEYLYVEFTSRIFRFVDDVEFWFPEDQPGIIHVRSASRLGYSDMGANRKRIEKVRDDFAQKVQEQSQG